jgi:Protein of unknown function (DUF2845)
VSLRILSIVTLLASVLASTNANAMRCGVSLVARGQWTYEVLEQCGEPIEQHVKTVFLGTNDRHGVRGGAAAVSIEVEYWVYDLGPHRLRRVLRFEDGQLVHIDTLDRGIIPQ